MTKHAGKTLPRTVTCNTLEQRTWTRRHTVRTRRADARIRGHGHRAGRGHGRGRTDVDTRTCRHVDVDADADANVHAWTLGRSKANRRPMLLLRLTLGPSSAYGVVVSGLVYRSVLPELAQAQATRYDTPGPKL